MYPIVKTERFFFNYNQKYFQHSATYSLQLNLLTLRQKFRKPLKRPTDIDTAVRRVRRRNGLEWEKNEEIVALFPMPNKYTNCLDNRMY